MSAVGRRVGSSGTRAGILLSMGYIIPEKVSKAFVKTSNLLPGI